MEGDLAAAWKRIDHPQRALLPYSPAARVVPYRAVELAFLDGNIDAYPSGKPETSVPKDFDPVWNRTHGVYRSRSALYVPRGAAQHYLVALPPHPRLTTEVGLLGATRATVRLAADGQVVWERTIDETARWQPVEVDLTSWGGRTVRLGFSVQCDADCHGFFADPLVWDRGGSTLRTNVLLILVDTLREDALAVMPHLRAFAERGTRFTQAIASATWTRPSLLSLYGGDLPNALGHTAETMIPPFAERNRFYRLAPPLLTRLAAAQGWLVHAIANNFFLLDYPAIGLDLGFETVDDVRHPVLDTPALTRAAGEFLATHRDRAFLLHLHYDTPHWPYTPPTQYLSAVKRQPLARAFPDPAWSAYLAEAAYADDALGEVFAALERSGLERQTLVIITGDHGEVFDRVHEHTVVAMGQSTLHHHGWSAYDEVLRVPLLLVQPGAIPRGVVTTQVRLFDLAKTIADYTGMGEAGLPARGHSLRPLIEGREKGDRPAFSEGQNIRALRTDGWLYLRREDDRLMTINHALIHRAEEIYNLTADPLQHEDRSLAEPERLRQMRERFDREAPPRPSAHYHLRLAPEQHPHRLTGRIHAMGRIRASTGPKLRSIEDGTIAIDLAKPEQIDFFVDPPEAALELKLLRDGQPFDSARLLVGEFGLPLLDGPLEGERLIWLEARWPPILGSAGDVLFWRDALDGSATPIEGATGGNDEVMAMMQRWGYAQTEP